MLIKRTVNFWKTSHGNIPVADFLDSLTGKQAQKVAWVMELFEELPVVPAQYVRRIVNTDSIWEIRVQYSNNIFRILGFLGFFDYDETFITTNGFQKKTQKTPLSEIELSQQRKKEYFNRLNGENMSDLKKYIKKRKANDLDFSLGYNEGVDALKLRELMKIMRKEAG